MDYRIQYGTSAFAVPGAVVDHYLRLAGEVQLKVLLCLLRQSDRALSPAQIAGTLRCSEEEVTDAMQFWVQAGVLDTAAEAPVQGFAFAVPAQPEPTPAPAPGAAVQRSSRDIKLNPSEIAVMLEGSQLLMGLFQMAEQCVGRPLNHMEQRSLVWLHSYLNMPGEVIMMLVAYACEIGKYSISYVEAIAVSWAREDILTIPQAEEELGRMRRKHTYVDDIKKLFEMKRSPTTQQQALIDQWMAAGYSMDMLKYAYETTIENTEKLSFKYINSILENCAKAGVTTPEEARRMQAPGTAGGRRRKQEPMTPQEIEEMNDYLSVVNHFQEDEA